MIYKHAIPGNMKTKLFFILTVVFLTSCNGINDDKNEEKGNFSYSDDKKIAIIYDTITKNWFHKNGYVHFIPDKQDLHKIDLIFKKAIKNETFEFLKEPKFKTLKNYYRQYICFINEKGEQIIYVNAFCGVVDTPKEINGESKWEPFDWKNDLLIVEDGGDCYWSIWINLTKQEYYDLIVNGEA